MPQPTLTAARRSGAPSIEQEELRGISRTVAEIEWLMVALVLLYLAFGGPPPDHEPAISMALFFYAAFVMSFRSCSRRSSSSRRYVSRAAASCRTTAARFPSTSPRPSIAASG